jgi:hypothetical protein
MQKRILEYLDSDARKSDWDEILKKCSHKQQEWLEENGIKSNSLFSVVGHEGIVYLEHDKDQLGVMLASFEMLFTKFMYLSTYYYDNIEHIDVDKVYLPEHLIERNN